MQTETENTLGTATYSPEDNKLRFYPFARLSKEDYTKIRSAGFIWAPKQELFVAPMWTPDREDLLLEWCGELGDEDKSLVDRAEERSDRFSDYSAARADDASQARRAVSAIADNIPLGQPILVGHHSERRARRDAERIENGMRKAIRMWDQSNYWKQRAAGAIAHAKYLERPDVRARRIRKLEAELRKMLREKAEVEEQLKFWGQQPPPTREKALAFSSVRHCHGIRLPDGREHWSIWSALDGNKMTVEEIIPVKVKGCESYLAGRCARWIAHYENRLAYERAMLQKAGGIVADRTGPEKGGACKCRVSRLPDHWLKIQKVNRISVTLLDNWGNGGRDFRRVIPFDKLHAVMSKAQVDEARAAGAVLAEDARGFFIRSKPSPAAVRVAAAVKEQAEAETEAIRESLKNGGVKVVSAPNLFPTPQAIADQLVDLADLFSGARVLEPSAGTGVLVEAIAARGVFRKDITAVELNSDLARALEGKAGQVHRGDFLQLAREMRPEFDRVVMNPPFDHGSDIEHVQAAYNLLDEGGALVAIVAAGPKQREAFAACDWVELPPGSFKEQGTGVNTAIIVWGK